MLVSIPLTLYELVIGLAFSHSLLIKSVRDSRRPNIAREKKAVS
jgi:hypothetical protein